MHLSFSEHEIQPFRVNPRDTEPENVQHFKYLIFVESKLASPPLANLWIGEVDPR